jgi:outer membrane protein TolC
MTFDALAFSRLARALSVVGVLTLAQPGQADTINLQQAVEMSLAADPRIKEREQVVEAARGLLREVQGNMGWRVGVNAFVGLAPEVEGGFYEGGAQSCTSFPCTPRSDGNELNGLSDWTHLGFTLIKPLYTFGKVENYGDAAQGNIDIKRGELKQTRTDIVYDTKRAYFGYLAARDIRLYLDDILARLQKELTSVEKSLADDTGTSRQSDLYALQTVQGLLSRYGNQARALEKISLDGLKVLTGIGLAGNLSVADERLEPVPFPQTELAEFQSRALQSRPEMEQLEAGLRARRALVAAKKADRMPDVYAGVIGEFNYASRRDSLDNPYANDFFNSGGLTPVVGVKWDNAFDVASARVDQAQAELEALNHKKAFALEGVPFEVNEAYAHAQSNFASQRELGVSATAARRWVVASLADFSAGLESADRMVEALKNYVLTQTEYVRAINEYNMNVAQLARLTGELK